MHLAQHRVRRRTEFEGMRQEYRINAIGSNAEPTGADTQVFCRVAGKDVVAISRERHLFPPATRIRLNVLDGMACLFDPATGQRI